MFSFLKYQSNVFYGMLGCLFLSCPLIAQPQTTSEQGESAILLQMRQNFYNLLDNSMSSLEPTQQISLTRLYERQLDEAASKIDRSDYLEEKLAVANRYWEYRDYQLALDSYKTIATIEPNSKYAAKAYMMRGWIKYGNLHKPEWATIELEKSIEVLEKLRQSSVDEVQNHQINSLAGQALSTLGDVYFVDGRNEDAIRTFEYLLGQSEIIEISNDRLLINVHSTLARLLAERGDDESAVEHYLSLDKIVRKTNELSIGMKISFGMECLRGMSKTSSEHDLVFFLEELWMAYRDDISLDALRIGNHLVLTYFFSKDQEINKKFVAFVDEIERFVAKLFKSDQLNKETWIEAHFIAQQATLLKAEHEDSRNRNEEVSLAVKRLKKRIEEKKDKGIPGDFKPIVPTSFPADIPRKILQLDRKFLDHENLAQSESKDQRTNIGQSVLTSSDEEVQTGKKSEPPKASVLEKSQSRDQ